MTDRQLRFTKMHGAGNDYVYVNGFDQPLPDDIPELARRISDRHFGVGGDGLILILPSQSADARMRMYNADGSEAEMCGNGIRCVAKFVYDHRLCHRDELKIETGAGVLSLQLETQGGVARRVRVDMGEPILEGKRIPTTWDLPRVVRQPVTILDRTFPITAVSMGNPHCVVFVDGVTDDWVLHVGPQLERNAHFPARVNVEFVEVISPREVRQRTWERGSGETLACGTGACAVCVAGVLNEKTERRIVAHLTGGDLELEWDAATNHVFMTGPAEDVFDGTWKW
ncbi:MAG: diaminopimelate epimerase [Pirellulales bacterium]